MREGVRKAGSQRERGSGDSFLATADSIRQQYRSAFNCALKHTRRKLQTSLFINYKSSAWVPAFAGTYAPGMYGRVALRLLRFNISID